MQFSNVSDGDNNCDDGDNHLLASLLYVRHYRKSNSHCIDEETEALED